MDKATNLLGTSTPIWTWPLLGAPESALVWADSETDLVNTVAQALELEDDRGI